MDRGPTVLQYYCTVHRCALYPPARTRAGYCTVLLRTSPSGRSRVRGEAAGVEGWGRWGEAGAVLLPWRPPMPASCACGGGGRRGRRGAGQTARAMNTGGGGSAGGMPAAGRNGRRRLARGLRGGGGGGLAASVGRRGTAAVRPCGDCMMRVGAGRSGGALPLEGQQGGSGGGVGRRGGRWEAGRLPYGLEAGRARPAKKSSGRYRRRRGVRDRPIDPLPAAHEAGSRAGGLDPAPHRRLARAARRARGGRCGSARRVDAAPRRATAGGCHAPRAISPVSLAAAAAGLAASHGRARPPLVTWRPGGYFCCWCLPAAAAVAAGVCLSAAHAAAMTRTVWACSVATRGQPRAASLLSCATPWRVFFAPPLSSKLRERPTPTKPHSRKGVTQSRTVCLLLFSLSLQTPGQSQHTPPRQSPPHPGRQPPHTPSTLSAATPHPTWSAAPLTLPLRTVPCGAGAPRVAGPSGSCPSPGPPAPYAPLAGAGGSGRA